MRIEMKAAADTSWRTYCPGKGRCPRGDIKFFEPVKWSNQYGKGFCFDLNLCWIRFSLYLSTDDFKRFGIEDDGDSNARQE